MFDDVLIESAGRDRNKSSWVTGLISAVVHVVLIGGVIAAGYYVKQNPEVIEKPIHAFVVSAAPPPPPPPPPPPASHASTPSHPQHVETPKVQVPQTFHQPTQVPKEVPKVDDSADTDTSGGVEGGVVGGVKGGVVGGVVGGVIGGVVGGTLGGQLGGQIGGTGDSPVRVGGDVHAPTTISRVDPEYTELARKARIEGIVIIEAIIDRNGNVTDARVLKPLPLGLDTAAIEAVKKWKFHPGTLNGQPVPVIYNLTVNFRLQ